MDECLAYFRRAVAEPLSVPPWSDWWAANAGLVEQTFPLLDWVRLKHRRLLGARQILQHRGELPEDYQPPGPLVTGSCGDCGERTTRVPGPRGGIVECPTCGVVAQWDDGPASG